MTIVTYAQAMIAIKGQLLTCERIYLEGLCTCCTSLTLAFALNVHVLGLGLHDEVLGHC